MRHNAQGNAHQVEDNWGIRQLRNWVGCCFVLRKTMRHRMVQHAEQLVWELPTFRMVSAKAAQKDITVATSEDTCHEVGH
jgi:hypothetical protein